MTDIVRANFEEKGKIFTEVVSKVAIAVIMQTTSNRIHGKIHVRPGERLKDEIDRSESTLALTEATIFDMDGSLQILSTNFVAVQKSQLIWVLPESEIGPGNQGDK